MSVSRIVPLFHSDEPQSTQDFYVDVLGLDVVMDMGWVRTYADPAGVRRFFVRGPTGRVGNVLSH